MFTHRKKGSRARRWRTFTRLALIAGLVLLVWALTNQIIT